MVIVSILFIGNTSCAYDYNSYIEIYNEYDFWINLSNYPDGKYILMNDIDLSGGSYTTHESYIKNGWIPFECFSGELDGNGHKISGLQKYGEIEAGNGGLFERTSGAIIRNLAIEDIDININMSNKDTSYFGALVGNADNGTIIEKCYVTGNVNFEGEKAAAMVGSLNGNSEIRDCYSCTSIYGASYNLPIVVCVDNTSYIKNCYNAGKLMNTHFWFGLLNYDCTADNGRVNWVPYGSGDEIYGPEDMEYYTGFDFDDVWEIDNASGYSYPQLRSIKQYYVEDDNIVEGQDVGNNTGIGNIEVEGIPVEYIYMERNLNVYVDQSEKLSITFVPDNATDKDITWSSSNSNIASVNEEGIVSGKAVGDAIITATSSNGKVATCKTVVVKREDSVISPVYISTDNTIKNIVEGQDISNITNIGNAIPIWTAADLRSIDNDLSGNYILMNDIDLSETSVGGSLDCGTGWKPIGGGGNSFSGIFDGNGHRITNVNIYGTFSDNKSFWQGLFGVVSGTVKNLGVENINYRINDFEDWYGSACIGGLAGDLEHGTPVVENCYVTGSITYSGKSSGLYGSGATGGLAGAANGASIKNCFTNVSINSSAKYIGGIIGESQSGTYLDCLYSVGRAAGSGESVCQGIGIVDGYTDKVFYCSNNGTDKECVPLTNTQMKEKQYFTQFDFDSTWEVDPYCSYNYPQLKNNRIVRVESMKLTIPNKTVYNQGDILDLNGALLDITYEDELNVKVMPTMDMLSGYDMSVIGNQKVNVIFGGKIASFDIEVKAIPVESISMKQSVNVYTAQSESLLLTFNPENATDKTITWSSSNPNVASVNEEGIIRGKSVGDTIITATSSNGKTASCKVSVLARCISLSIDKNIYELNVGDVKKIIITTQPENCNDIIKWKTDDSKIADVEDGEIYAVSEGKTIITAYTDNGVETKCQVYVTDFTKKVKQIKKIKVKIKTVKNVEGKKIIIKLSGKSICDGYEVQYASKKKFKGKKTVRSTSGSIKINKLKKGKKYYVRARSYKIILGVKYYGKWSSVKKIIIKK